MWNCVMPARRIMTLCGRLCSQNNRVPCFLATVCISAAAILLYIQYDTGSIPWTHIKNIRLQQPIKDFSTHQPDRDFTLEKPVKDFKIQQPVKDLRLQQPVKDFNAQQPVKDSRAQRPVKNISEEQPVRSFRGEEQVENVSVPLTLAAGICQNKSLLADPSLRKVCGRSETISNRTRNTSLCDVTVVTAYFNLGRINKRAFAWQYTPDLYKTWMTAFQWIDCPLIVYTDSQEVVELFKEIRSRRPLQAWTKTFFMPRKDLWAFSLAPEIKAIFRQPGYPHVKLNTVNENYSCVMHAKFELVNKVIREELYDTRYVAWLDIGLFRDLTNKSGHRRAPKNYVFKLTVPYYFKDRNVGYSVVSKFDTSLTPFHIIKRNRVWVGGAMFLGRPEVLYVYTQDYMRAVRKLINMKWMSTDQQVIYIMYHPDFDFQPRVRIQTFSRRDCNIWFCLGYIMRNPWIPKGKQKPQQ